MDNLLKMFKIGFKQSIIDNYIKNNYNYQYLGTKGLFYKGGTIIGAKAIVTFAIYSNEKIITKTIKNEKNIKKYARDLQKKQIRYYIKELKTDRFILI